MHDLANELTVPALPCRSIDEIEAFYTALGFTRTYRQVRPNPYLALRCSHRGDAATP